MIILGVIILAATVFALVKQYETKMILFISGLLMCIIGGNPLAAFQAFAARMSTAGLIEAILSVMGFAFVMKTTECDKHLVNFASRGLLKVRPILIPGAALVTFAINTALPSAAGASAAVGAILIPILMEAGISPAMAAAAVLTGTFGSMISPGLSHNPFIANIASVEVMDVIAVHYTADIVSVVIGAASLAILAFLLKEDGRIPGARGKKAQAGMGITTVKVNYLKAVVPVIPILILILGATKAIGAFTKISIPGAMLIGSLLGVLVSLGEAKADKDYFGKVSKSFFDGMGSAYANIMGIIIAAAVFVKGLESIGLVQSFISAMIGSPGIVKVAAAFGPFLLGVVSGSGDAAAIAFNEAVTPQAVQFGLKIVNMGSLAALGGALGRTMSPLAGAAIIVAGLAGVNPLEVAKRNAIGMIIAAIVAMIILL
ncbi:MAG: C4-dicarboxylate transporter DcuC [Firmicutes bacterium]|nr:C4-dicarboxylate transporter DcuC [Bacillota bacterium]